MEDIKKVSVDLTPKKKKEEKEEKEEKKKPKEKTKRIITIEEKWDFNEEDLCSSRQLEYIEELLDDKKKYSKENKYIYQTLKQKLNSYRNQDQIKDRYVESEFIKIEEVIELLKECNNTCFYCKKLVKVLYELVREPEQWTLERIDNTIGHNKGNLTIACLSCNLGRRTMHQNRYVFTKQLNIVKKSG